MANTTFKKTSEIFKEIEKISSRNEMSEILSNFFKTLDKEESQIVSYMIQGRVAPFFVSSEFNYSEKSILNLLGDWSDLKGVKLDAKEIRLDTGDIGDTVEKFVEEINKESKDLSLKEVYEILWKVVNTVGTGSVERKNDIILNALENMSPLEARYFARIICGSLRLGINAKTLLDVYSIMKTGDKSLRKELDRAYGACADPGVLFVKKWDEISVTPGIPVQSRLVERVANFEEVFERIGGEVIVQPKFDGLRCQIHKIDNSEEQDKKLGTIWEKYIKKSNSTMDMFSANTQKVEVKLFTRNLEDVTEMFPEIVEVAKQIDMKSFILDSEILGWNYEKDTFLTYQETMQRRRKYGISKTKEDIPVQALIFDVLYENGESLLEVDTSERVDRLLANYGDTREGIRLAETNIAKDVGDINKYFKKYIEEGYEGVIVKQRQGGYTPGARNYEWIKLKKSMEKGYVDTVDLVAVGYYLGSGRRSELGLGAVLGAVYNEKEDRYEAITKVGTGFDDESLKEISTQFEKIKLKEQPKDILVNSGLEPDVWVEPKYVFTVEADEISKNIGKCDVAVGGGLSLRFPRLVDWNRDKRPDEATSVKELLGMFEKQKNIRK